MSRIIIENGTADRSYWHDLWSYRELFAILAWRDVAVRYKQTVIGILWAVIRPFLVMVVFTIVFGRLASMPSESGVPYPILVFVGMLPWFLCATILGECANSLIANANLIGKVYFPRIIIPASSVVVALVDFIINLVILGGLMVWYQYVPSERILALPLFTILASAASFGPAIFIATLNVRFRDFRYVVPFIVQFGLYISPVGFSSTVIPEHWRFWYSFNPVVGVIDAFRWCLLTSNTPLYIPGVVISCIVSATLLWGGFVYFRRAEKQFADLI